MAEAKTFIPIEFLRACFDYDPETGRFWWRERPASHFTDPRVYVRWCRHRAGKQAFTKTVTGRGYKRATITFNGREIQLLAHRVAWAIITGEWPADEVDHRNCDEGDNRFANLREATGAQNRQNRRVNSTAASGVKAARPCPKQAGKWISSIWVGGKSVHLGRFTSAEAANAAYAAAAKKYFGDFARAA